MRAKPKTKKKVRGSSFHDVQGGGEGSEEDDLHYAASRGKDLKYAERVGAISTVA